MYCLCSSSIRVCLYINTKIYNIEIVAATAATDKLQITQTIGFVLSLPHSSHGRRLRTSEEFRSLHYFSCYLVLFIIFFFY